MALEGLRDAAFWVVKNGFEKDVSKFTSEVNISENNYNLEGLIAETSDRIKQIRAKNYFLQSNLENNFAEITKLWACVTPDQIQAAKSKAAMIRMEGEAVRQEIGYLKPSDGIKRVDAMVSNYKSSVNAYSNEVKRALSDILNKSADLCRQLTLIETTLSFTSMSSFQPQNGENPIISIGAKDTSNKMDALLTLTNQRVILESRAKIGVERLNENNVVHLKVVKKNERKTVLEKDIGSVAHIEKGKLGFFSGHGLIIDFIKSEIPKLKLAMNDAEADLMLKYFNEVKSGKISEEAGPNIGLLTKSPSCPLCGSPYTDGIYHRHLNVSGTHPCKYCGTLVDVPTGLFIKVTGDAKNAWCMCPNCGEFVIEDVTTCNCGAKLPPRAEHTCVSCGKAITDIMDGIQCPEGHYTHRNHHAFSCPSCGVSYASCYA